MPHASSASLRRTGSGLPWPHALTDVAKGANAHCHTASRAFSDPGRLGPQTLRKVLTVAQKLGYEPPVARATETATAPEPRPPPSRSSSPISPTPSSGPSSRPHRGECGHRKQTVVLADTDLDPDREREVIAHLKERADGLVVCSPGSTRTSARHLRPHPHRPGQPRNGGHRLCNRRRRPRDAPGRWNTWPRSGTGGSPTSRACGAPGPTPTASTSSAPRPNRSRGWTSSCSDGSPRRSAGGTAAAASVMASGASAVITHNDLMAFGVVTGARAWGCSVPEDLSVIGSRRHPLRRAYHGRP